MGLRGMLGFYTVRFCSVGRVGQSLSKSVMVSRGFIVCDGCL
jgi:hypothetical protein